MCLVKVGDLGVEEGTKIRGIGDRVVSMRAGGGRAGVRTQYDGRYEDGRSSAGTCGDIGRPFGWYRNSLVFCIPR